MGFFSADCQGCGHPLLSSYATNEINAWMQKGVTIFADGSTASGVYDGYGRYDGLDRADGNVVVDGTVWHEACWNASGCPTDYRGESAPSEDQGYFFDDGDHDLAEPVPPVFDDQCTHPNCARHGKSPCEGVDCSGRGLEDRTVATDPPRSIDVFTRTPITPDSDDSTTDTERLRTALGYLLLDRDGTPGCEHFTDPAGACFTAGRTADARYGADRACASCIAHAALTGQPILIGPGTHAAD